MIKGFVPTLEVSRQNVVLLGLFESVSLYSERLKTSKLLGTISVPRVSEMEK